MDENWPRGQNAIWHRYSTHSRLNTRFVTRLTWQVPLLEYSWHFRSTWVHPRLVLCVCFVDRCLSFFLFSFGHCVVWLPLWYLQTLLSNIPTDKIKICLMKSKWVILLFNAKWTISSGAGTTYPYGTPDFTPSVYWGCVARSFVDRCLSWFVLVIVLSVFLFAD
jgi:hypothetical protein